MRFHCEVCNNKFKKFILFEGHFEFNVECREKHESFVQCYLCTENFRHLAALKYHLQQHTVKRVKFPHKPRSPIPAIPLIPKITLKKQWNFKIIPKVDDDTEKSEESKNTQLECQICRKQYRSLFYLEQHLKLHKKKQLIHRTNDKGKSRIAPILLRKVKPVAASNVHSTTIPSKLHQCHICKIKLKHGGARLTKHIKSHSTGKFKCEICNIKFTRVSFSWHRKVFHGMRIGEFVCKICDSPYTTSSNLAKHELIHKNGTVKCTICNIRFTLITLLIHQREKHSGVSNSAVGKSAIRSGTTSVEAKCGFVTRHTNTSTKTKKVIRRPILSQTERLKNGALRCKICQAEVKQSLAAQHMYHHKYGEFECEPCNIRFSRRSFAWHQKRFHPLDSQSVLQCHICKTKCATTKHLKNHLKEHETEQVKCERCNIRFSPLELISHQKRCPLNVTSALQCNVCSVTCSSNEHLKSHSRVHEIGQVKCQVCDIRFTPVSLVVHQKRFHPDLPRVPLARQCSICKAILGSSKNLKKHLRVHEIGQVKCEVCDIRFTSSSLYRHQMKYHPDLQWTAFKQRCLVCRHICGTKAVLDAHSDMHRNGEFQCETHKIKFTFEGLQEHNRHYHTKETAPCPTCKMDISKNHLQQHMIVHTNGNEKCEICNIRFTHSSLIYHRKIVHNVGAVQSKFFNTQRLKQNRQRQRLQQLTHAMQFQCKLCKQLCGDAKRLETHMDMHKVGDLDCRVCKVPFTKASLAYHVKRYHPWMERKDLILKALRRHMSVELNTLSESESKEIPIILEDQYKLHVAKNKLQCIICKLSNLDGKKMDIHLKVHINGEYKCDLCAIWFTENSLASHQKRCHPDLYEERVRNGIRLVKENCEDVKVNALSEKKAKTFPKKIICDICKSKVGGKLAEHQQIHISGEFECKVCNIRFTEHALRYHQKRFHPEMPRESRAVEHSCNVCALKFSDLKSLDVHVNVHAVGDVKCDICDIPFTKASLLYHMKRFHPHERTTERTAEMLKKALERNVSSTVGSGIVDQPNSDQFKCAICGIVSWTRKYLYCHIKVHAEGDLKCQVCNIWFTKPSLEYHYKRFHPELNVSRETVTKELHKCNLCELVSSDESRLKEHMKVHSGNRQCHICNVKFTLKSLAYHYKRFHPNLPQNERILKSIENCASKKNLNSCSRCGKSFTRICYLKLHMKTHRNGIEPVEIPFVFSSPVKTEPIPIADNLSTAQRDSMTHSDDLTTNQSDDQNFMTDSGELSNDQCDSTTTDTRSYVCYVCKEYWSTESLLHDHLTKHIVYKPPIDPFKVYLSGWDPDETREIILNQPLVMVANLRNVNLKSLAELCRSTQDVEAANDDLHGAIGDQQETNDEQQETKFCGFTQQETNYYPRRDTNDLQLTNDDQQETINEQQETIDEQQETEFNLFGQHPTNDDQQKAMDDQHDTNADQIETKISPLEPDLQNFAPAVNDCDIPPNTTQNDCDEDVVLVMSDSDDECVTIQHQLNNNSRRHPTQEFDWTQSAADEPLYISSDDEEDITELFHCYFCNGRFKTLSEFGVHGKICQMKSEL